MGLVLIKLKNTIPKMNMMIINCSYVLKKLSLITNMSFYDILSGPSEAWSNLYVNSITLGATGAVGSFYTTAHIVSGVTGAAATGNITLGLTRVGNMVSVTISGYSATAGATGTISTTTPIPAAFRNTTDCVVLFSFSNAGTYAFGTLYVTASTGLITFYPGVYLGSAWNTGVALTTQATALSYNLS
jgi:hypothetical protein